MRLTLKQSFLRSAPWEWIWWKYVPGSNISVKWPTGYIVVDHNDPRWCDWGGAVKVKFESADPNDFYRPWMEENVGEQGWDWDWKLGNNDAAENRLTIRFRTNKIDQAVLAKLMWA